MLWRIFFAFPSIITIKPLVLIKPDMLCKNTFLFTQTVWWNNCEDLLLLIMAWRNRLSISRTLSICHPNIFSLVCPTGLLERQQQKNTVWPRKHYCIENHYKNRVCEMCGPVLYFVLWSFKSIICDICQTSLEKIFLFFVCNIISA